MLSETNPYIGSLYGLLVRGLRSFTFMVAFLDKRLDLSKKVESVSWRFDRVSLTFMRKNFLKLPMHIISTFILVYQLYGSK